MKWFAKMDRYFWQDQCLCDYFQFYHTIYDWVEGGTGEDMPVWFDHYNWGLLTYFGSTESYTNTFCTNGKFKAKSEVTKLVYGNYLNPIHTLWKNLKTKSHNIKPIIICMLNL